MQQDTGNEIFRTFLMLLKFDNIDMRGADTLRTTFGESTLVRFIDEVAERGVLTH